MQFSRFNYRTVLVLFACLLAFGLAAELPQARALDDTCGEICNDVCDDGHGGCVGWDPGCTCTYRCADGYQDTVICGL